MGKTGFRKKPSGRYEYRFYVEKKQYSVSGGTVRECEQKAKERITEIEAGLYTANKNLTVHDLFNDFLEDKADNLTESAIIGNEYAFKRIDTAFGKVKVKDLEKRQIKEFRKRLLAEVTDDGSRLTSRGANEILQLLRSMFSYAVANDYLAKNICSGLKNIKKPENEIPATETIHRKLSDDEITRFLEAAADSIYIYLFHFLINCGCRCGEALALTWHDCDFKNKTISISKTVTKCKKGMTVHNMTKTEAGRRVIPMNQNIINILYEQRKRVQMLFGDGAIFPGELVFPNRSGVLAVPSSIATMVKNISIRAGIEPIATHAFRHYYCCKAVDSGISAEVLRGLIGHSDINTLWRVYYHNNESREAEAAERLNNIIPFPGIAV